MNIVRRFPLYATLFALAAGLLMAACGAVEPPPQAESQPPVEQAQPAEEVQPPPEPEKETIVVVVTAAAPDAEPVEPEPAPASEEPVAAESSGGEPQAPAGAIHTNGEWIPQVDNFQGVQFAMVPAGCFTMGANNVSPSEKPAHEQCFEQPFWISVTEVTNDQFGSDGSYFGDNFPRNYVTWFEAKNYCESIGARLPTEAEWEYAARGPSNYTYPFGDVFQPGFIIHIDNAVGAADVGTQREGASWVGAFDMAGNVREWVSSAYADYPYQVRDGREDPTDSGDPHRVVRGGSYMSGQGTLRLTYREWYDWQYDTADIGFRCARDG